MFFELGKRSRKEANTTENGDQACRDPKPPVKYEYRSEKTVDPCYHMTIQIKLNEFRSWDFASDLLDLVSRLINISERSQRELPVIIGME